MINIFGLSDDMEKFLKDEEAVNIFSQIYKFVELNDEYNLHDFINKHIDYLTSNVGISNLKKLMENNGEKYYPILWAVFFITSKKKNFELANLFSESSNLLEQQREYVTQLKGQLEEKDRYILEQSTNIKQLEARLETLTSENTLLKANASIYSDILKISIQNGLLKDGKDVKEIIKQIIESNNSIKSILSWLEKNGIIVKKEGGGYGLSPKAKILLSELKISEEKSFMKYDFEQSGFYVSPVVDPNKSNISSYSFSEIGAKKSESNSLDESVYLDVIGDYLLEIDKLLKENKNLKTQVQSLEISKEQQANELGKKEKEIAELKAKLEELTGKSVPEHIKQKAIEAYTSNNKN